MKVKENFELHAKNLIYILLGNMHSERSRRRYRSVYKDRSE